MLAAGQTVTTGAGDQSDQRLQALRGTPLAAVNVIADANQRVGDAERLQGRSRLDRAHLQRDDRVDRQIAPGSPGDVCGQQRLGSGRLAGGAATMPGFPRPGDFFRNHRDDAECGRGGASNRQVSIVLFLTDQKTETVTGDFAGGTITFYGLMDFPDSQRYGLGLVGEKGLLVAFRSDMRHEVTEVTGGTRVTVVSWFLGR